MSMTKLNLHMRSGKTIVLEVDEYTVTYGVSSNDLRNLKWTLTAGTKTALKFVDLSQIEAITEGKI